MVKRFGAICGIISVLCCAPAVEAANTFASGTMTVSARNAAHLRWNVVAQPDRITVTDEQIRNGYVDIDTLSLNVRTNNPAGFFVIVKPSGPAVAVRIDALAQVTTIGTSGGVVRGDRAGVFPLVMRVMLSKDARPGDYAFPITLNVVKIAARS